MDTELDALRKEVRSARLDIAELRAEIALLRSAPPGGRQQYQPSPGTAPQVGVYTTTFVPPAPGVFRIDPFAVTGCATPAPQIQTFTVGG